MTASPHTDVFVSYKRDDRSRVAPLVDGLRSAGLQVWWDADIPGGTSWRATILEQLDAARCVIVVWSEASVSPAGEFVHEEAERANTRGVLLPVRIDAVLAPLGFGQIQAFDLIGWPGAPGDERLQDVVNAANAVIHGGPRPRPVWRRTRPRVSIGVGLAVALALIGFFADAARVQGVGCRLPGATNVCAAFGWGGVPSAAEQAAWAARTLGDCEALRSFVSQFPAGTHAEEATRRLEARRSVQKETWRPEEHRPPLFVTPTIASWATEGAARVDALERGLKSARLACAGFDSGVYRLRGVRVDEASLEWSCRRQGDGARCSFEGHAVCNVDARHSIADEVCE